MQLNEIFPCIKEIFFNQNSTEPAGIFDCNLVGRNFFNTLQGVVQSCTNMNILLNHFPALDYGCSLPIQVLVNKVTFWEGSIALNLQQRIFIHRI